MSCWLWNIDLRSQDYFAGELKRRHLRQGWGYHLKLDLRRLAAKVKAGKRLDDQEESAWNHCNLMVEYIRNGDLVVVKNVPDRQHFTIVRASGEYGYSIEDQGDFCHRHYASDAVRSLHRRQLGPSSSGSRRRRTAEPREAGLAPALRR